MSTEELKQELTRQISKLKFKAGQQASELHDLIEDRLMTDYEDIMPFAEATYKALKEWEAKTNELKSL